MATNWTQGSGVYTLTTQLQEKGANNWPPTIPNTYPPYTTFTQGLGSWGYNNKGQLGLGNVSPQSSPTQIGSDNTWLSVAAGAYHTIATKTDGSLWSCGRNNYGQLGANIAATIDKSSPVQVVGTTWLNITAGQYHTIATKTDGSLWAWGLNNYGQLGANIASTINRSSPVQVGALTTWGSVSCAHFHTVATKTDGTLWAWGRNNYGQLGANIASTINRSSPVQVVGSTNWSRIAAGQYHTIATKTDGTLWAWGRNNSGQLGANIASTINRSSPVQVGLLTTWLSVAAGAYHTIATKTDGSLWSWGANSVGQLGQNDGVYRSSPVQVGLLTTWSNISTDAYSAFAIKTDGTLWGWGDNATGQLGLNNTSSSLSPVQVGTLNTWIQSFGGATTQSTFAILSQV